MFERVSVTHSREREQCLGAEEKWWSEESFGIMWVGAWAVGGEVWDTQGKVQPEVGKDMPKGRERCGAQWTSELKASNQSRAHTSL